MTWKLDIDPTAQKVEALPLNHLSSYTSPTVWYDIETSITTLDDDDQHFVSAKETARLDESVASRTPSFSSVHLWTPKTIHNRHNNVRQDSNAYIHSEAKPIEWYQIIKQTAWTL